MGLDAEIYSESAAVMDLEVVLPPTMYYDVLKVHYFMKDQLIKSHY